MGFIAFTISIQGFAMVQPPRPPMNNTKLPSFWHAAIKPDPAALQELPTDLKRHLIPFILSGNIEKGLVTVARINKTFHALINDPRIMLRILDWLVENARYAANVITLVKKLQNKPKTLPVLQGAEVKSWLEQITAKLKHGQRLHFLISGAINLEPDLDIEQRNMPHIIELLQDKYLDVTWSIGDTYLGTAALYGRATIVRVLLANGFDPNAGWTTPLMHAVERNDENIVTMLLDAGAKTAPEDAFGRTALSIAKNNGNAEILLLLRKSIILENFLKAGH